jgi:hypothetical protein
MGVSPTMSMKNTGIVKSRSDIFDDLFPENIESG